MSVRRMPVWLGLLLIGYLVFIRWPADATAQEDDRTAVALEALSRLKGMDLEANPAVKGAVMRVLEQVRGKPAFVQLVRDFDLKQERGAMLEYAVAHPGDASGVDAARWLLEGGDTNAWSGLLGDPMKAAAAVEVLSNTADRRAVGLLAPVVTETNRPVALRQAAVRGLARSREGAAAVLELAKGERLPGDVRFAAGVELRQVRWKELKESAESVFPAPQVGGGEVLPPVSELLKRTGDVARGSAVFRRDTVNCVGCHQVNGDGVDFGPNLSEIGTKLGKDALYESILDPSAGNSFGYEAWAIELKDGEEAFGLVVSETEDELAIKLQGGVVNRLKKSEVVKRTQQKLSIMPAGLQAAMTVQELVDLVEYLAGLKKKG